MHLFNSWLAFLLFRALRRPEAEAWVAAALFAVNPVVVEQLMIIAGRAEVMSATFILLSALFYLREGRGALPLSLISSALALLSKENGIVSPFVIALALWLRRDSPRRYLPLSFFIPPALFYLWFRKQVTGMPALEDGFYTLFFSALLKTPKIIAVYLGNSLFPLNLHSHRMQPAYGDAWLYSVAGLGLLAFFFIKRNRLLIFASLWYLANLLPKVPLLAANTLMLDHWVYLSNLAVFFLMAAGAGKLMQGKNTAAAAVRALLAGTWLFWIVMANRNITLRGSDIRIYEHAARYSVSTPMLYNLGREYYLAGEPGKALKYLEVVFGRDPENEMYANALALTLCRLQRRDEGLKILDAVLAEKPSAGLTLYNKASVLRRSGDPEGAVKLLESAVRLHPDYSDAYLLLADICLGRNEEERAEELLEKALEIDPYNAAALGNLGALRAGKKDYARARKLWERALSVEPGLTSAAGNISKLKKMGY